MKISVVIPTHKRPGYLAQAIESALTQSSAPLEVIVASDVEDEATRGVFERAAANATVPMRYLGPTGERGASASRNRGALVAAGEFLAFLDDDDLWCDGHLALAQDAITRNRADISVSWLEIFTEDHKFPGPAIRPGCSARDAVGRNPGVTGSNIVVRRAAFEDVGGFDVNLPVSNDIDFFYRLLSAGSSYTVVPHRTARQRKHQMGQLTGHGTKRANGLEVYLQKHEKDMTLGGRRYIRMTIHRIRRRASSSHLQRMRHLLGIACNYSLKQFLIDRASRKNPAGYKMRPIR